MKTTERLPFDIVTKRVYATYDPADGRRILIDRLWPRGLAKAKAQIDHWSRETAPTDELRKWYAHRAERWEEFQRRYYEELDNNLDAVQTLVEALAPGRNTFLFASRELELNNATALQQYLLARYAAREPTTG